MNSYVLAELMPLAEGNWGVGLLHPRLQHGEAFELAAKYPIRPNTALIIGSCRTRTIRMHTRHIANMTINERDAYRRRLHMWIDWLRALGILRFNSLASDGEVQIIPAAFARGMTSLNPSLIPEEWLQKDCGYLNAKDAVSFIEQAPATSIAGMMRSHELNEAFTPWLDGLPRRHWHNFRVPMYEKTPPLLLDGARMEVSLWIVSTESTWPVIGHLRQLRIDRDETICVQDFPLDRFGLAWSSGGERRGGACLDRAYRTQQHRRLDEAFDCLSAVVASVFSQAARLTGKEEREANSVERVCQTKRWESLVVEAMQPAINTLRHELLVCLYPYDGQWRSPAVIRYLRALGETHLRQPRLQALNAFPAVMDAITSGKLPQTAAAIDASRPLLRALAEELEVPIWVVRRASKLRYPNEAGFEQRKPRLEELMRTIEALGPKCPSCDSVMLRKLVDLRRQFYALRESAEAGERLTHRLFAAIGRSAEIGGWELAAASVSRLFNFEALYIIEDYWHVAENTAMNALVSFRKTLPRHGLKELICRITDIWLSLQSAEALFERSDRWLRLKWNLSQNTVEDLLQKNLLTSPMTPLFEPFCWRETGVGIEVLIGQERLLSESEMMRHCVASYWVAVATHRVLVLSLVQADSGLRATLAMNVNPQGEWRIRELKGEANVDIAKDSGFDRTAKGLLHWLTAPASEINKVVLQSYLDMSSQIGPAVNGYVMNVNDIQSLPACAQEQAAACYPGAGPVDKRIARILAQLVPDGPPVMSVFSPKEEKSG